MTRCVAWSMLTWSRSRSAAPAASRTERADVGAPQIRDGAVVETGLAGGAERDVAGVHEHAAVVDRAPGDVDGEHALGPAAERRAEPDGHPTRGARARLADLPGEACRERRARERRRRGCGRGRRGCGRGVGRRGARRRTAAEEAFGGARLAGPAARERATGQPDEQQRGGEDARGEAGEPFAAVFGPPGRDPPPHREHHGEDARDVHDEHERQLRVGAGTEAVQHDQRPAEVRQPVDDPPRARADAMPQEARDRQCEHEVERDRAEPEPQRPVAREERHHRVLPPDRRKAVDDDRGDVEDDHDDREQRDVAVDGLGDEAGPPGAAPPHGGHDPEDHADGQQDERGDARGAARDTRGASSCSRRGRASCEGAFGFGPAADVHDATIGADETSRESLIRQPLDRVRAAHDRGGGRDVGVNAGRRGDAHRPPAACRRFARRRVDDVMQRPISSRPTADRACSTSPGHHC